MTEREAGLRCVELLLILADLSYTPITKSMAELYYSQLRKMKFSKAVWGLERLVDQGCTVWPSLDQIRREVGASDQAGGPGAYFKPQYSRLTGEETIWVPKFGKRVPMTSKEGLQAINAYPGGSAHNTPLVLAAMQPHDPLRAWVDSLTATPSPKRNAVQRWADTVTSIARNKSNQRRNNHILIKGKADKLLNYCQDSLGELFAETDVKKLIGFVCNRLVIHVRVEKEEDVLLVEECLEFVKSPITKRNAICSVIVSDFKDFDNTFSTHLFDFVKGDITKKDIPLFCKTE